MQYNNNLSIPFYFLRASQDIRIFSFLAFICLYILHYMLSVFHSVTLRDNYHLLYLEIRQEIAGNI